MKFRFDLRDWSFIRVDLKCSHCKYIYELRDNEVLKAIFSKKNRKCPLCGVL